MITPEYCRLMARYGSWMNERLYQLSAQLDPTALTADRGAFFGSIMATLNHLLWGDRVWLGRFVGAAYPVAAYGVDSYAAMPELIAVRAASDRDITAWAAVVSQDWLDSSLSYRRASDGETRCLSAAVAAVHFFNHGTHHRGQLTTLLKQAGVEPGVTDLPFMPGVGSAVTASL